MRSIKFILSLVLVALGVAAFSASAGAAVPPPGAPAIPSPLDGGQPDLVAEEWSR